MSNIKTLREAWQKSWSLPGAEDLLLGMETVCPDGSRVVAPTPERWGYLEMIVEMGDDEMAFWPDSDEPPLIFKIRSPVLVAQDVLDRYPGPLPVDVERIAEAEGLEVVEWGFPTLEEAWFPPVIAVRAGLDPPWRRWVIAHALGHYYLHRGNQVWFRLRGRAMEGVRLQEEGAEQFAAWLLMPEEEVGRLLSLDLWSFDFDVPLECVALRFPK